LILPAGTLLGALLALGAAIALRPSNEDIVIALRSLVPPSVQDPSAVKVGTVEPGWILFPSDRFSAFANVEAEEPAVLLRELTARAEETGWRLQGREDLPEGVMVSYRKGVLLASISVNTDADQPSTHGMVLVEQAETPFFLWPVKAAAIGGIAGLLLAAGITLWVTRR